MMTREEILAAAKQCVCGDRDQDYGSPEKSFEMIADLWEPYLRQKCEAQAKEIEKLRGQLPRWIPVEERLPENFRKVLCWGEYFRYGDFNGMFVNYALGYQNNGIWGGEVANGTNARALAWMPLPEPPKEER